MMNPRTAGVEILQNLEALAAEVTKRQFELRPELSAGYGPAGRARCNEDARFHLSFLAAAVDANSDAMFLDYVEWTKSVLVSRKVPARDLAQNLEILASVLERHVPAATTVAIPLVRTAIEQLPAMPTEVPSFIDRASAAGAIAGGYLQRLLAGDTKAAIATIADALLLGVPIPNVCSEVLQIAQQEVGRLWQLDEISVATEHYCSGVTQQVIGQICTRRRASDKPTTKRMLAMCAPGELHDIGLRIVTELLQLEQWQTVYLGANVPPGAAVQMCVDRRPDVLLISASLAPRIAGVAEVVRMVRERDELNALQIVVGGRVFARHPEVVQFTGANGCAETATALVELLRAS